MKKLIALSLAAVSSLMLSGSAMALPRTLAMSAEGRVVHQATCYLIRNNGGVKGSCDYECDIEGPRDFSPTLTVIFREWKNFMNSQCLENEGRLVQTFLEDANYGFPNQIFDQHDYPAKLVKYVGSEEGGLAIVEGSYVPISLSLC
jgi:hypothetical protein